MDCVLSVHADDILIGAAASQLQSFVDAISNKLAIKWAETLPVATEPSPWVRYLGKQWRRTPQGFQVAVSADYLKKIFAALGLEQAKAAPTPAVLGARSEGEPLCEAEGHLYRTLVGRLMWMLPERADIAYVTKELARSVHAPLHSDMGRLRRLVKYLIGTQHLVLHLTVAQPPALTEVEAVTDANWATSADLRSTSGGLVKVGGFMVAQWSRTQPITAMSSCEAELLALNEGARQAKLVQGLLGELHMSSRSTSTRIRAVPG